MTEDWSCLSQQDTDPYAQICKEAVQDDNKFNTFNEFEDSVEFRGISSKSNRFLFG